MRRRLVTGRLARLGHLAAIGPRAAAAAVRGVVGRSDDEGVGRAIEEVLGDLKAGSLKLGQILAQVADDLPPAARARLGRLFAEVPPLPIELVRDRLQGLPGGPFASFDEEPFAAASLGQVHAARLPDGAAVAVKVQYPDVADALASDLDLLRRTAMTVTAGGALFDGRAYFEALRDDTLAELDYAAEAERRDRLATAVAGWPDLVVPRVHRAWSSPTVLTSDHLTGPTLHAWLNTPTTLEERAIVADRVIRAVLAPPLVGVVNADAHPGNFVVLPEAIGLLDFGAVRSYAHAAGLRALLTSWTGGSSAALVDALAAAGVTIEVPQARRDRYVRAIDDVLRPIFERPFDFSQRSITAGLGALKQRYPRDSLHLRLTPDAIALFRALLGLHHALRRLAVPVDVAATVRVLLAR